jgi:porin
MAITNRSTDPLDGAGDFFHDGEHLSSLEFGWTSSKDRIYHDNAHITLWHVDESAAAGTPGGWGASFQYVTFINDQWMPFVRGGYADEGGSLMERSISLGIAYNNIGGHDLLGVAVNWGVPNEDTFGPNLDTQMAAEVFYRFQLTEQFVLTPDIQYIKDPAQNPTADSLWVIGLRARLAL